MFGTGADVANLGSRSWNGTARQLRGQHTMIHPATIGIGRCPGDYAGQMTPSRTSTASRNRRKQQPVRAEATRMFAFAVPGLGTQLGDELGSIPGVQVDDAGFDGRSDVVNFTAKDSALRSVLAVRLAEDVFVEVGRTLRSEGDRAQWVANRLWRPQRVSRALAARARLVRPVRARATFRVITRVMQERSFLRTDLRRQVSAAVQRQQPAWRFADPADVEVWVIEYQAGKIIAGLRASDVRMRQHDGRESERRGALRPTVAAAMVRLAGELGETLLDPCCGSGTILAEATQTGWQAHGVDIDPDAAQIARQNVKGATIRVGDARELPMDDASVDACVSNLPFGQQYEVQGEMEEWLSVVLAEMCRVTRTGGRIVLLAPRIPRGVIPGHLVQTHRLPIRLLGTKTSIWAYDRR